MGHNVVVDGYNTDDYYHINFGWGGSSNGWYLIPEEIPYGLTVIEGLIVDVLKQNTAVPDLSCSGTLAWSEVTPGNIATGSLYLNNIGQDGSDLAWKITEWPTWGSWSFSPAYGHSLMPENSPLTITVNVIAPNQQNQEYTGNIKIVNIDDSSDYQIIPVSLMTNEGIKADLSADGSFTWTDIVPEATVAGSFTVENVGTEFSNLSWEVSSWPDWGTWTITPIQGDHLTPEDGAITINVSVIAPEKKKTTFSGELKVVNTENISDYDIIPVTLSTPHDYQSQLINILKLIWDRLPNSFSVLRYLFGL